jgi:superfamily II DNA or RNA helicase
MELYDYQLDAIKSVDRSDKGVIIMPTGTGKTFVESTILSNQIKKTPYGIYVVNAPKIMLSYQLLLEIKKVLTDINQLDVDYMMIHSGKFNKNLELDDNGFLENVLITTDENLINYKVKNSKVLVIVSTYNSIPKLKHHINLMINDESHYLVSNRFHNVMKLDCEKIYSFTATPRFIDILTNNNDHGMNNKELFGDILYEYKPIDAIRNGKMLMPKIHYLKKANNELSYENKNIPKVIKESFVQHQNVLGDLPAKLMVTISNKNDIFKFLFSNEYKDLINDGVDIFIVHSDSRIGNLINGKKYNRYDWLKKLKSSGDSNSKFIVIHYNIITEGIDVPGLTGVLILRQLSKTNIVQIIGRVSRLHPIDRNIENLSDYIKPYSYVILPYMTDEDIKISNKVRDIIHKIRNDEYQSFEYVKLSNRINYDTYEERPIDITVNKDFGEITYEVENDISINDNTLVKFIKKIFNFIRL